MWPQGPLDEAVQMATRCRCSAKPTRQVMLSPRLMETVRWLMRTMVPTVVFRCLSSKGHLLAAAEVVAAGALRCWRLRRRRRPWTPGSRRLHCGVKSNDLQAPSPVSQLVTASSRDLLRQSTSKRTLVQALARVERWPLNHGELVSVTKRPSDDLESGPDRGRPEYDHTCNGVRRRDWLRMLSAVAAGASGAACGGGSSDRDGPSPVTSAPPDAPPKPSPVTGAPIRDARYRSGQDRLFTRVDTAAAPSRLPDGSPFPLDRVGPTSSFVSARVAWPWTRPGGDWIDAAQVRHGNQPWASVTVNAVSGPTARSAYELDVTEAIRHIQRKDTWNALYLRCPGFPRVIAGALSTEPPTLLIEYEDGSRQMLNCHVSAAITSSSAYPNTTAAELQLPVMLEFSRPSGPVRKAQLSLTVTQHWSGSGVPRLEMFIVDPPVNSAPVVQGLAVDYPFDQGLQTHPGILGVQRILDGTALSDVVEVGLTSSHLANYNALQAYDPAMYGTGSENRNLLPHRSLGKWIGAGSGWSLVPSTYAEEGFQSLAPGVAAIRIFRDREVDRDGAIVGYGLSQSASGKIFMPPEHFGKLREIFVRYYLRLGTPDGGPYVFDPSTRYQVRTQEGAPLRWTDCGGKIGIMPAHDTTEGGVSGTSGGGRGWQMRMAWSDVDLPTGPDVGGMGMYLHWFDFLSNVPGHNYGGNGALAPGDDGLAQQGGLGGMVYAHHWYCIETRLRLNSVDRPAVLADGNPHVIAGVPQYWTPDGELDVWIDGRLAYAKRGLVLRSLPLQRASGRNPQLYLPPVGELGIRDLWFNWFHGGLTKSSRARVLFMTGIAWGTRQIGPMRLKA